MASCSQAYFFIVLNTNLNDIAMRKHTGWQDKFLELCVYAYIHTYMHTYIHTYIYTYIQTCIHSYIHTSIHTYIHTYIHTRGRMCSLEDLCSSTRLKLCSCAMFGCVRRTRVRYCFCVGVFGCPVRYISVQISTH